MATILIADDNDHLRQLVRRTLEVEGHVVIEANCGEAALKAFKANAPDMAILDVNMGEMSGFEVCQKIREDSYGVSIPIVFLTALSQEKDLLQGFQEGADDYIRKPFNVVEFNARIKAHLSRIKRTQSIVQIGEKQFKRGSIIDGNKEKYKITSRISTGGMGVIFRGYRISDGYKVAIKTLNSQFLANYKDIQRFLREANATINIKHDNLAAGIEVVRSKEHCFFVMQYIEAKTVADILEKEIFIRKSKAVDIVKQIAKGLDYLYKLGLVHRDVKPGNILVNEEGHAVLVDMGLTKSANSQPDLTTEGVILGTPYYLSPEQALGDVLDIRSDIYSLGATLYHMVTGSVPFRGNTTIAIINARFLNDPVDPQEFVPEITPDIANMINKMMERNADDRYQTPEEVLENLEKIDKS